MGWKIPPDELQNAWRDKRNEYCAFRQPLLKSIRRDLRYATLRARRPCSSHTITPNTAHVLPNNFAGPLKFSQMNRHTANPSTESTIQNHCEPRPWRQPSTAEERFTPINASRAP